MQDEIELVTDYPASIADMLINGEVDLALVPVATIPLLKTYHIISNYCIGCKGEVASVCLFSDVPIDDIETILLDYQSKSSVGLLKILLKEFWKIKPQLVYAEKGYEENIKNKTAGLVIGDRAFAQRKKSKYIYDLGTAWFDFTGLPFMFAAWISSMPLDENFIARFNEANALGFNNLQTVIENNICEDYDLHKYYTENISYQLDYEKKFAMELYLKKLKLDYRH